MVWIKTFKDNTIKWHFCTHNYSAVCWPTEQSIPNKKNGNNTISHAWNFILVGGKATFKAKTRETEGKASVEFQAWMYKKYLLIFFFFFWGGEGKEGGGGARRFQWCRWTWVMIRQDIKIYA